MGMIMCQRMVADLPLCKYSLYRECMCGTNGFAMSQCVGHAAAQLRRLTAYQMGRRGVLSIATMAILKKYMFAVCTASTLARVACSERYTQVLRCGN